jgi:hypothetical protein
MHDIFNSIPETNRVYIVLYSTVHSAAAVVYLQFVLLVMLFRPCNMFCTFTAAIPSRSLCAVPNMAVLFFSSLISCFPDMLFSYCLSDYEMVPVALLLPVPVVLLLPVPVALLLPVPVALLLPVPVAPIITGITFASTFHMR